MMNTIETSKSYAHCNLLTRAKRVSDMVQVREDQEESKKLSSFALHKLKAKALHGPDITIEERLWASRLAGSFDTTVAQKRLILKQFIAAIKWGK